MTAAVIQRIRAFEQRRNETLVLSIRPHRAVAGLGGSSEGRRALA